MKTVLALTFVFGLVAITVADSEDDSFWKRLVNLKPDDKSGRKVKVAWEIQDEKDLKRRYYCNRRCKNYCFYYPCKCNGAFYSSRRCSHTCRECVKYCTCDW